LGTDEVYRHGRALLAIGPQVLATMHDARLTLRNRFRAECPGYPASQALGFTIDEEEVGVRGVMFRRFSKGPC
jgi:hypothetical protein